MKTYTIETEGDFLLEAREDVLIKILHLRPDEFARIQEECEKGEATIHAQELIWGYPSLTIWTSPPWKRILTDEEADELWEQQSEDVDRQYADYPLDLMSTNEVLKWKKENEEMSEEVDKQSEDD